MRSSRPTRGSHDHLSLGAVTPALLHPCPLPKCPDCRSSLGRAAPCPRLPGIFFLYTLSQAVGKNRWDYIQNPSIHSSTVSPPSSANAGHTQYHCPCAVPPRWSPAPEDFIISQLCPTPPLPPGTTMDYISQHTLQQAGLVCGWFQPIEQKQMRVGSTSLSKPASQNLEAGLEPRAERTWVPRRKLAFRQGPWTLCVAGGPNYCVWSQELGVTKSFCGLHCSQNPTH